MRDLNSGTVVRSWPDANTGSLAFSPDGKTLLAGFGDQGLPWMLAVSSNTPPAKLWDISTGELVRTLDGAYSAVAFSKDGSKLIAGSYTYSNYVDGIATYGVPSQARAVVFAAATGQPLMSFEIGDESLFEVAISPDGTRVMTAGYNKVRLWDLATGQLQHTLGGTNDYFYSAAFSPDGSQVAGGAQAQPIFSSGGISATPALMLWDVASGQLVRSFTDPNSHYDDDGGGAVRALAFSPDGSQLAFGTYEWWDWSRGDIHVVNATNGEPVKTITGAHAGDFCFLAFAPNGSQLISAAAPSIDGSNEGDCYKVWDVATSTLQGMGGGYYDYLNAAALSADGTTVVTASRGQAPACKWDASSGKLLTTFAPIGVNASVSLSGDGSTALLGYDYRTACLVDTTQGTILHEFGDVSGSYNVVSAITDNGSRAVFWNWPFSGIVETATGSILLSFSLTNGAIATDISPGGAVVVVANPDRTARLIDGYSGKVLQTFSGHTSNLTSVALSADGKKVVTGCADGKARLWDAASGQLLFELAGHSGAVNCVAISSNGTKVVTGAADRTAKVWHGQSGQLRRTLAGHAREVVSVGISADGTKVLTCGSYAQAYLWDTSDLPASLAISQSGGKVIVQWEQGTLQSRSGLDGSWQDVSGAASPYTVPAGASVQFFRLK